MKTELAMHKLLNPILRKEWTSFLTNIAFNAFVTTFSRDSLDDSYAPIALSVSSLYLVLQVWS